MKRWQVIYDFYCYIGLEDGTIDKKIIENGCFFLSLNRNPLIKITKRFDNCISKFIRELEKSISINRKQKISIKEWNFRWLSSLEV